MGATKEPTVGLYEADYDAWTRDQVEKIRRGDLAHLDVANLVEEIECASSQQRSRASTSLRSRSPARTGSSRPCKWSGCPPIEPRGESRPQRASQLARLPRRWDRG